MADKGYIVELSKFEAHKCDESALSAVIQAADILAGIAATGIMWAPTFKPALPEPDTAVPKGMCGPCRLQWTIQDPFTRRQECNRIADITSTNSFNKINDPEVSIVFPNHSFLSRRRGPPANLRSLALDLRR